MFICFDRIHTCDRQTDRQTPHDGIGRAYTEHCKAKTSRGISCEHYLAGKLFYATDTLTADGAHHCVYVAAGWSEVKSPWPPVRDAHCRSASRDSETIVRRSSSCCEAGRDLRDL